MRFLLIMIMLITHLAEAQTIPCFTFDEGEFVVSGNATIINDDTVRLTQAINNQAGFVWSQSLVNFDFEYDELDLLVVALGLGSMNGTEICVYETVQSLISFRATLTNTKG